MPAEHARQLAMYALQQKSSCAEGGGGGDGDGGDGGGGDPRLVV
jgi:hypothetical protein